MTTKPKEKTKTAYDYNECRDWLQAKYGYDERDYAGKYASPIPNPSAPYQDFWHFVLDQTPVHNGCYINIEDSWLEDAAPWQREIINRYLDHFGTTGDGYRCALFWVEW